MNPTPAKTKVRTSTMPNSGKGLFAEQDIKKGEPIAMIVGPVYTEAELKNIVRDEYILEDVCGTRFIDVEGPARYANDARGLTRVPGVNNNSAFLAYEDGTLWLESTKKIKAGEEIFVAYGKQYWKEIKQRIDAQNAQPKRSSK